MSELNSICGFATKNQKKQDIYLILNIKYNIKY